MYDGEIVDSHMHLWDVESGQYPWLTDKKGPFDKVIGSLDKIRKNFHVQDYEALVKPHLVTKSVHIEANPAPKKAYYETEWLQKIADSHGFPHAIVFYADLTDPDLENILKDHCQFPNVRGVRQILYHEKDSNNRDLLNDPHWQKGLNIVAKQLLSFDISVFGHQIPHVANVAKHYPDVSFILDHLGWPLDLSDDGFETWKGNIQFLAENPNVYLKLSGIGLVFKSSDKENIERFLHSGIEAFGEDRCLFGSNIPPDSLFIPYGKLLEIFKTAFSRYENKVQKKLFYENAKSFYDL